ncbi:MAG: thiamine ABC transporter substrate-binding protein [Actinomycetota bacterium]
MKIRMFVLALCAMLLVAACGSDDGNAADDASSSASSSASASEVAAAETEDPDDGDGGSDDADAEEPVEETPVAVDGDTTVRLLTHDSFSVSDGLFDAFTLETGITVEVISGGDAGELVARSILNIDQPEGDVLFGIDNTFLQRGLDADLFIPHQSPGLASVPDELELDPEFRVTPIDVGDVCVNYWIDQVAEVPTSLDDLTDPALASSLVTMDPETSSPGFAFLLATIAKYGEDGWEDYWQQLADGGITVTSGWSDAYFGEFIAGGGDKALVTSYASSPVAEVLFAEEPLDSSPTGVLADSCFRQIEFAGVLAGTEVPDAAGQLIDFMLSDTFQEDIPLNMFVFPANADTVVPESFAAHAVVVDSPQSLSPEEIEANRSDWTARWAEIVLGR